jgi:hypothetical protein
MRKHENRWTTPARVGLQYDDAPDRCLNEVAIAGELDLILPDGDFTGGRIAYQLDGSLY